MRSARDNDTRRAAGWTNAAKAADARKPVNQCGRCKDGYHIGRGCIERACDCWCRLEGVAPEAYGRPQFIVPDEMGEVFATLRSLGVECRATRRLRLVWKPQPAELPDEARELLKRYAIHLVRLLWPREDHAIRPYWHAGPLVACIECGTGVALYDPLDQPRHVRCGWLAGKPVEAA